MFWAVSLMMSLSLPPCQLTSSLSTPHTLISLLYSSTLLLTHSFSRWSPPPPPLPVSLRVTLRPGSVLEEFGRWTDGWRRFLFKTRADMTHSHTLTHTHTLPVLGRGGPAAPMRVCCTVPEQEVDSRERVRIKTTKEVSLCPFMCLRNRPKIPVRVCVCLFCVSVCICMYIACLSAVGMSMFGQI